MQADDAVRLVANISGRVQGVGFRFFTQSRARTLGLTGWVRNEYDGSVSLEAEGPREKLELLLHHLRSGPGPSRVEHVESRWGRATGEYDGFSVRR